MAFTEGVKRLSLPYTLNFCTVLSVPEVKSNASQRKDTLHTYSLKILSVTECYLGHTCCLQLHMIPFSNAFFDSYFYCIFWEF